MREVWDNDGDLVEVFQWVHKKALSGYRFFQLQKPALSNSAAVIVEWLENNPVPTKEELSAWRNSHNGLYYEKPSNPRDKLHMDLARVIPSTLFLVMLNDAYRKWSLLDFGVLEQDILNYKKYIKDSLKSALKSMIDDTGYRDAACELYIAGQMSVEEAELMGKTVTK